MQMIAVLDNIRSVHNVGSIFRTADGAGVKEIYLCGITPSPLDRFKKVRPKFAKVALGAERFVQWKCAPSAATLLRELRRRSFFIVALERAPHAVPLAGAVKALRRHRKIGMVVGAEVDGVSADLIALADAVVEIPMRGNKESLNVSVAFGVAAYMLLS